LANGMSVMGVRDFGDEKGGGGSAVEATSRIKRRYVHTLMWFRH
jgi:hypothetical protein